ncbi:beta propeller repeat protein [Halalkalicoccus subterraneus]|uniref:glycosyl hydrolase n=1 Tax=Halalkalicoccus subterraneus TaxID=2675002 RepID=UPI000EFBADF6|nr:glycosyl hydrolase [Halalkalicoccus subterraneus]
MDRRRFIELASAAGTGIAFAGCVGSEGTEDTEDDESEPDAETSEQPSGDDEGDRPEPEGGDGRPYTQYDLDVHDERENGGHPVWIDRNERLYGRSGARVLVSDDWWETTETLYSFEEEGTKEEYVKMVLVPDSGRIIAATGGRGDVGGKIHLIDEDLGGAETLYQFDYGRMSNEFGHATHEDIVVISTYALSDFEANRHANEVILSTDGGRSFEKVLEPELVTEDAANHHIHDVEYDPYAERIWVAVGDHGNSQIYWSDDLGDSWEELDERGAVTMITQIAAFRDCVAFGTDGVPEGIIRWARDGPNDEPDGVDDLVRPHVQIETDPDDDVMELYARRRWHIREDDGRELCLMPFGYSTMHDTAEDSVLLASVDGDEWYELHRTETRDILLSNVMGPLSMDGDRRTLVADSFQAGGYQIDASVPDFWN